MQECEKKNMILDRMVDLVFV